MVLRTREEDDYVRRWSERERRRDSDRDAAGTFRPTDGRGVWDRRPTYRERFANCRRTQVLHMQVAEF